MRRAPRRRADGGRPRLDEWEQTHMLMSVKRPFREVPARWLLIVTPLTVAGFVAAGVCSSRQVTSIEDEAVSVATDGGPSIEDLSTIRGLVRDIETGTGLAVDDAIDGRPFERSFFDRARPALRQELTQYAALPFYAGERELYDRAVVE